MKIRFIITPKQLLHHCILLTGLLVMAPAFAQLSDPDKKAVYLADTSVSFSFDRNWSPVELEAVFKLANERMNSQKKEVPVFWQERLLQKITENEALWFVYSDYYGFPEKTQLCLKLIQQIVPIIQKQLIAGVNTQNKLIYEKELSYLTGLSARLSIGLYLTANHFLGTMPELTATQQAGLNQMKSGVGEIISGFLLTFEKDFPHYSEASICRMATSFQTLYPQVKDALTPDLQKEFDSRINALRKNHLFSCVRQLMPL